MVRVIFFFIFVYVFTAANSQIIIVLDHEDGEPIPDVVIFDNSRNLHAISNQEGIIDIATFLQSDFICLQHFSYEPVCLTPEEIESMEYRVRLVRRTIQIDETVVTALRWEDRSDEVPNRVTPVVKSLVDFHNPQTAADMLSLSGEVFIQKSQLGGGSPMIRGFATNRVLIVVDGVRMNNAIFREGNIQSVISIDPSVIKRTEVIFGPGAAIYGSDAIGGVMSFTTKRPLVSTGNDLLVQVEAYTRYASASNEKTGHIDINIGDRRIALFTGITYSDFGDMRMGKPQYDSYLRPEYVKRIDGADSIIQSHDPRVQYFSGYNQINTINKLRFRASDELDFTLSNIWSRISDVPRYDRLIVRRNDVLRFGEWRYGPQEWMMNLFETNYRHSTPVSDNLRLLISNQYFRESRHSRALNSSNLSSQKERVDIFSFNIDADKSRGDDNLLYYGVEYVTNSVTSTARNTDIDTSIESPEATRYPDGINRYHSVALYGGYKHSFGQSLMINTGLRYNYVTLHSTIEDNSWYNFPFTEIDIANGAVTGSAGIVKWLTPNSNINLNLSTGFRAPNLDDAGKVFDSAPGVVVVPNSNLKPEYAWNVDLGSSTTLGGVAELSLSGFYTVLNNAMVRRSFLFNGLDSIDYQGQLSRVEAIVNSGRATVYGVHMSIRFQISNKLLLRGNINITDGSDEEGVPLRHAAPLFGSTHLVFKSETFEADLYTLFNGRKPYRKMAPSERDKAYMYAADEDGNPFSPEWATLNFKVAWNINSWATLNGGVENILDLGYRPYSSGIVASGRNFITTLRIRV